MGYLQQVGTVERYNVQKVVEATSGGLTKWLAEDWRDVKTAKVWTYGAKDKGRPYPACRPATGSWKN